MATINVYHRIVDAQRNESGESGGFSRIVSFHRAWPFVAFASSVAHNSIGFVSWIGRFIEIDCWAIASGGVE